MFNVAAFKLLNRNCGQRQSYPASTAFLFGKFFSMYKAVGISGISGSWRIIIIIIIIFISVSI